MNTSVIYTMGTALDRAAEARTIVQVLVQGQWLAGRVAAVDGHGLVLERDDTDHAVVRLSEVAAVRVVGNVPDGVGPQVVPGEGSLSAVPRPRAYA